MKDALNAAGVRCVLSDRNVFRPRHLVINWGASSDVAPASLRVCNKPAALAVARNKLATFRKLSEAAVRIPLFWTSMDDVVRTRSDSIILERHTLTGESGAGIVVKRAGESLSPAPLYVEYLRKNTEYRVHVFNGKAIATQQKRRESDAEQSRDEALLRNRDNGWVFCVQGIDISRSTAAGEIAVRAVAAVGLHFGAVDIVWASRDDLRYVLEINTKPGLSSPTVLSAYVQAIKEYDGGTEN